MSIFFYGCVTLDGYLADSNHGLRWLDDTGDIGETSYDEFYSTMDITIMGKRTYDAIKDMEGVEQFYGSTINYVFTNSVEPLKSGFIAVKGNIVDFVKRIEKTKNIWIIGGTTLVSPLINQNLIDNYIIQIAPVLLGAGIPLFSQDEGERRIVLESVKQFGQFAELRYKKKQVE